MPLIMCAKFQINQIILTLFSGVWDKNPILVADKVVKCLYAIGIQAFYVGNTGCPKKVHNFVQVLFNFETRTNYVLV